MINGWQIKGCLKFYWKKSVTTFWRKTWFPNVFYFSGVQHFSLSKRVRVVAVYSDASLKVAPKWKYWLLSAFQRTFINYTLHLIAMTSLTHASQSPLSFRNQHIDLLCKSMDWFLFDRNLRSERAKSVRNIELISDPTWGFRIRSKAKKVIQERHSYRIS